MKTNQDFELAASFGLQDAVREWGKTKQIEYVKDGVKALDNFLKTGSMGLSPSILSLFCTVYNTSATHEENKENYAIAIDVLNKIISERGS